MVTDITIAVLFTMVTLFLIVTNFPVVTFATVLTRVTSIYWLLLFGCTRSISLCRNFVLINCYRGADKSLARRGRKQAWKQVRDVCDFNKFKTRAVIRFLFLQGKAPKEIHAILTETLVCFLPGRAKDLSAPLYYNTSMLRISVFC